MDLIEIIFENFKTILMRVTFLLLFISFYSFSNAQKDTTNEAYDTLVTKTIGGEEIVLGTQAEYKEQMGWSSSGKQYDNALLCRFIGFKSYWLFNLITYMDAKLNLTIDKTSFDKKTNIAVYTLAPHIGNGQEKKTYIKAKINSDDRVVSLSISGNLYNMVYMFLWYWPSSGNVYSKDQFKKGKMFYKYVYLEKISFDWTGVDPVIKITKAKSINLGE